MPRMGCEAPPRISASPHTLPGPLCGPFATQGRSYRELSIQRGLIDGPVMASHPEKIPHGFHYFGYSTRRSFSGPQNQVVQILRVQLRLHVR